MTDLLDKGQREDLSLFEITKALSGETRFAQLVNELSASSINTVSSETVSFAAGAAGTTGVTNVVCSPVMNSLGTRMGHYNGSADYDTSLSWGTGTCLTTEVLWRRDQTDAVQLAALSNGEYAINYFTGDIRYKKATTATSDTASYKIRWQKTDTELTLTGVTIDNVRVFSTDGAVTGCNYAWLFTNAQDLSTVTERWQGFGGYDATADMFRAFPIVLDDSAMPATPAMVPVGGEYRAAVTTYADGDATVLQTNVNGALRTTASADIPTALLGGSKTVATSGTGEALGASLATKSIYIRAKGTNTGTVYVGDNTVDAVTNQQISLAANDSITISIDNRATVYVDVAVNGEGVDYLCLS